VPQGWKSGGQSSTPKFHFQWIAGIHRRGRLRKGQVLGESGQKLTRLSLFFRPRVFVFRRDGTDMSILWAAIIGLFVGFIAKLLMSGTGPSGCLPTAVLGIAGGIFAAVVGQALGWYAPGQPAGLIGSVVGAVILLWLYKLLRR
jgi:uncharacterized membrane protein YeaQ/YmgE (transglycosylase-associated protein family)